MEHVSRRVGIQVGQHTFTDIDYADDVALLVDKEESFHTALTAIIDVRERMLADLDADSTTDVLHDKIHCSAEQCHPSRVSQDVPNLCHAIPRLGKTRPGHLASQ